MSLPDFLYRSDDGARFILNGDGSYSLESSLMAKPHKYEYQYLIDRDFSRHPPTDADMRIANMIKVNCLINGKPSIIQIDPLG